MFDEMSSLFRNFDNLFQSALREEGTFAHVPWLLSARSGETSRQAMVPAMECFTRDNRFVLRAELPGVDPEKVEITVQGDRLVLSGEKESHRNQEDEEYWFQEVSYGRFERSFVLPEGVKADDIKANYQNGVLEVTFPAKETVEPRKIPVTAEPSGKKEIQAA
jgi:HSP20 family protein